MTKQLRIALFINVKTSRFASILSTEPHAPHSPSEAPITLSSVSSVYNVGGDSSESRHSTPVAARVGRGKFCSSVPRDLG